MISTELPTILAAIWQFFVAVLAVYVWFRQIQSEKYVESCMNYVREENKRAVSLRKMAEVEATLTELTDAYDALLTSQKKLRSRIGMRANREKKRDDAVPDPQKDPAGYKAAMRIKLQNGQLT